ncbi:MULTISPECIES: thiamine phosphate synthase [unclassified Arthrobacter]|uniref:thiamine phosphate synthase n=1 Tax=unclassified Arthrobacter TaxID=235627 RepID=UPI002E02EFD7|nr:MULTISPECIES: thiamine phosphate synthase [unclassified Arthrobacter]MEC5192875.1 thiamine-phosphate pyrophosphorylase [Arthrobacter sp. MP_M4]MEC5204366.1 thiamine-phosphate pyrophosphorylase [Arthrobacter sp. MP_M7]
MSPDAVHTIARLYLCTDARRDRGDFADFVDAAFAGGVDIIQLRDKSLDAAEELELLEVLHQAAHRHGRLWAVNDRADLASLSRAPVFHIGQKDLTLQAARDFLGKATVIGRSTHSPVQVDEAIAAAPGRKGLDYFCVGPVWETPTKPGSAAVGLELVRYAAQAIRRAEISVDGKPTGKVAGVVPWFAIGGINAGNVERVVEAGARRIVVVRAITEANDPTEAARTLLAALEAPER